MAAPSTRLTQRPRLVKNFTSRASQPLGDERSVPRRSRSGATYAVTVNVWCEDDYVWWVSRLRMTSSIAA